MSILSQTDLKSQKYTVNQVAHPYLDDMFLASSEQSEPTCFQKSSTVYLTRTLGSHMLSYTRFLPTDIPTSIYLRRWKAHTYFVKSWLSFSSISEKSLENGLANGLESIKEISTSTRPERVF